MQASRFERLSFDPFPLLQNGFVAPEVDVRRCDVVQALVVALMVVVIDEGFDLGFEITGQEVVFQQDAVLQGLMPTLDLALGLRDDTGARESASCPCLAAIPPIRQRRSWTRCH